MRECVSTLRFNGARKSVPPKTDVYPPSQDTAALARVLRGYTGDTCLEIGFGSGAVLTTLAGGFKMAVGTDILSVAQAVAAKGEAHIVLADRATCFRDRSFDLVAFNPPYLPSGEIADATVDGGRGGIQVPMAFVREALRVLKADGVVVVLLSDEGDVEGFKRSCEGLELSVREKSRTELFFENLYVFEIRRKRT
jgi:release factor glutamine methyltransferase